MEVEELNIHGKPICETSSGSVLAERLVLGEPDSTRKMAISPQDQQLVLH